MNRQVSQESPAIFQPTNKDTHGPPPHPPPGLSPTVRSAGLKLTSQELQRLLVGHRAQIPRDPARNWSQSLGLWIVMFFEAAWAFEFEC